MQDIFGQCPYYCGNKTSEGYCKTTACINTVVQQYNVLLSVIGKTTTYIISNNSENPGENVQGREQKPDSGLKYSEMYDMAREIFPEMYDLSYFSHTQDPLIRINSRNKSLPLEIRVENIEKLLRLNFTRSIVASCYSIKHPSYKDYVAMRLNSDAIKDNYGEDLYYVLVQKYGKKPGMHPWSSYYLTENNCSEV